MSVTTGLYLQTSQLNCIQVPHVVQQVMSKESTPILSGAIPAFESFMTKWENLSRDHPRLQDHIDPGLQWARRYYNRMDRTRAYVISMCKHLFPAIRLLG